MTAPYTQPKKQTVILQSGKNNHSSVIIIMEFITTHHSDTCLADHTKFLILAVQKSWNISNSSKNTSNDVDNC